MLLPEMWENVAGDEQAALETELQREINAGHSLYRVPVKVIARRHDCDDVLVVVTGSSSVAAVHLQYGVGGDPLWPQTQLFGSLTEWIEQAAE